MGRTENSQKLSKKEILRGFNKFDEVFKKGKAVHNSHTILFYLPAEERKIGFVVSKRVRTAVQRNKLKRKLREIYRLNKSQFPEDYHFILLAKGSEDDFYILKKQILDSLSEMRKRENLGIEK